ncbi:arylesterase [Litoreibacter roseus]|uniref:arylesterase n=1 Tax=Litoreibacter roseus TaxID=2601869 RepID=UPI001FA9B367|nr:arylesterase [Litoreibacter roseus]
MSTPSIAQEITIAALGDSLTQGYGLKAEDGFVPQLDAWLNAQGRDVDLLNAGVSGDTTAGGKSRIDWTLTEDVDALIVALGGNDLLRGIDPDVSRDNLTAILEAAESKGVPVLLAGIEAPGNYGPEYKAAFDGIFVELAARYNAVFYENFLAGLTINEDRVTAVRKYMQADGIHPNPDGVSQIVADIGPKVLELLDRVE